MPASKNPQSGFSLIEMLVAVVILAIGLLGLAQLQVTAIKANAQSTTSSAATAIAQKIVEEISAMGADDPMFGGPTASTQTWPGSPITVAGAGTYNITYDVTAVQAGTSIVSNLFNIEITYANLTKGGEFDLSIAGKSFKHTVQDIGKKEKAKESPLAVNYKTFVLGQVVLKSGKYQLTIKPKKINKEAIKLHQGLMTLRDVTLVPQEN